MTQLRLSIEGNTPEAEVPGVIRGLGEVELEREVLIPMGLPGTVVELAPGRYFVEVFLPSGELLRRFVDLQDTAQGGVDVRLKPSRSPHEWLAFQHLLVAPERLRSYIKPEFLSPLESFSSPAEEPTLQLLWPLKDPDWRSENLLEAFAPKRLAARAPQRIEPHSSESKGSIYRYSIPFQAGPSHRPGALLVTLHRKHVLIPVPLNWLSRTVGTAPIEIVVNGATDAVSTTVADPLFAPVLGYLASGYSELAARTLENVSRIGLFLKHMNPFAAAAGGYVLVQSWLEGEEDAELDDHEWRRWIHNLAKRFPSLPDGAILHGRILLTSDSPDERNKAAASFVEAFDRGVPCFAAGLRMLLEGLLAFEDEQVPAELRPRFELARRHVRQWATWMDPHEPFTTLHIPPEEWP
jgi:hypothetical protein